MSPVPWRAPQPQSVVTAPLLFNDRILILFGASMCPAKCPPPQLHTAMWMSSRQWCPSCSLSAASANGIGFGQKGVKWATTFTFSSFHLDCKCSVWKWSGYFDFMRKKIAMMKVAEQKNVQSPRHIGLMYTYISLGWPLKLKTQIPIG